VIHAPVAVLDLLNYLSHDVLSFRRLRVRREILGAFFVLGPRRRAILVFVFALHPEGAVARGRDLSR
jgi:hypothetical protein